MNEELIENLKLNFENFKERNKDTIFAFKKELKKLYLGRLTDDLFSQIRINYYNNPTPLIELSQIHHGSSPYELIIKPYDRSILNLIVQTLNHNKMTNCNIFIEKHQLRLVAKQLTTDNKKKIVHNLYQIEEKFKIQIRNNRHHFMNLLNKIKKEHLSEDLLANNKNFCQEEAKKSINELESIAKNKENQIMKV